MTDIGHHERPGFLERLIDGFHDWRLNKIASPEFQRWAAGSWFTRAFAKKDSERVYDLVAGFVYSQTLLACTELELVVDTDANVNTTSISCMTHLNTHDNSINKCISTYYDKLH